MELYIIRHGEAVSGMPDEAGPPLSGQGAVGVKKVADHLQRQGRSPSHLYSSPLRRALQTAEIFQESWKLPVEQVSWLQPGIEPFQVLEELGRISSDKLALVGHLPALGWLTSILVWGGPPKEISIPKGGVVLLQVAEWKPASAKFKWILNPDIL